MEFVGNTEILITPEKIFAKKFAEKYGGPELRVYVEPKTNMDQAHAENFFECMRTRQKPNLDVDYGYQLMVAIGLGVKAYRTGAQQTWKSTPRDSYEGTGKNVDETNPAWKKTILFLLAAVSAWRRPLQTPYKMAVIGLVHAHVWGHLSDMLKSKDVTLVGVAEPNKELLAEAKKAGVPDELLTTDYRKMIDEKKPDLVWSFVENNRHLEIVEALAPKKINIIFEKPLASTYKDSLRIQELANKYGIQVMCNYQMAWWPWPANYTAKQRGGLRLAWPGVSIARRGGPRRPE